MSAHGIFAMASLGKTLAGYLGLFEALGIKLDKLAAAELETGGRNLEQAMNSEHNNAKSLLVEARARFNKAISLEKDEKLAMAYLGLGLCHYYLGDMKNSKVSFDSIGIDAEKAVRSAEAKAKIVPGLVSTFCFIIPFGGTLSGIYLDNKLEKTRKVKEKIDSCKEHANKIRRDLGI